MQTANPSDYPTTEQVVNNIRAEIARKGWSHRQFAERVDLSPAAMSKRMRGVQPITIGELVAYAFELQVSPATFFEVSG